MVEVCSSGVRVCVFWGAGGLIVLLTTGHLEVKCDVATKRVNGDLSRFYIGSWGQGNKEWQFPEGKGCVL